MIGVIATANFLQLKRTLSKLDSPMYRESKGITSYGFSPPYSYKDWRDCGSYIELQLYVTRLYDIEVSVDADNRKLIFNFTIDTQYFATLAKDVKIAIPLPEDSEDVDVSTIITHVNGDDVTVKVYKTNTCDFKTLSIEQLDVVQQQRKMCTIQ
jgi:hypothetical protein